MEFLKKNKVDDLLTLASECKGKEVLFLCPSEIGGVFQSNRVISERLKKEGINSRVVHSFWEVIRLVGDQNEKIFILSLSYILFSVFFTNCYVLANGFPNRENYNPLKFKFLYWAYKLAYKLSSGYISVSHIVRANLEVHLNIETKYVIYNIQDNLDCSLSSITNTEMLCRHFKDDIPNVVYVGRLTRQKNIHSLVNCFENYKDFNLILVGDGDMKEEIEQRFQNVENISLTGWVSEEEVDFLMKKSDCLIFLYDMEPCSLAAMKAIELGNKVILPFHSGVSEYAFMRSYKNINFLLNPNSVDEIHEKIYN